MSMQARPSTTIMTSNVFVKDDLCKMSKEYALGSKALTAKRDPLKESDNIHDIKDKDTLSSMKSEMDETRKKIDKHVSSVMLQSLMKLDAEHEKRTAAEFTKLLSESDKGTLIKLMNISTAEFKVLELYEESKDFSYIDEKLGWSAGASFKTYITLSYKIKKFFNKEFLNIYEDFLADKTEHEAKTINRLHNFRKKCIEADLFKPRDVKVPRIMDGKIIKIKEEEIVTLLKLEGGESHVEIAKDLGWSNRYPLRYENNLYKKFTEEKKVKKKKKVELSTFEKRVNELLELGFTASETSKQLDVVISVIYDTKKRIKKKMSY